MLKTTVGQFLVNDVLPAPLRDYNRVYDQKGLDHVLQSLAEQYPDQYRSVTKKLADLGGEVAYRQGGLTFGIKDLLRPEGAEKLAQSLRQQVLSIYQNPKLKDDEKSQQVLEVLKAHQDKMAEASYGQALRDRNPLALQASLGFRGNKASVTSMLGADLLYPDHNGNLIPYPILKSYSQGLSPLEFMASMFGTRKSVATTKIATADAGALNKQITQAAHQVMVSRDHDDDDWYRGDTPRGYPVQLDDPANVGTLLAHPAGPYGRNTVLTPRILQDLKQKGIEKLLVRSPLVGGISDGGLHARDLGIRNRSGLTPAGSFIGIEAGQAIGEPLTQLQLSAKHGGASGASKMGGFKLIESLANPPKNMPYGATHAQLDGTVDRIDVNPAGGHDLWIDGKKHYVPNDMELKVQKGDTVEAGDVLSNGVPNPREVVLHKGIGEGRRYLVKTLYDAYRDSKVGGRMLRRNLEPVVRGLVNHVTMTDFWNGHAPEDVVNYGYLEHNWSPRVGADAKTPRQAVGHYLEAPVLHHTIGTKIRKSMLPELEHFGVQSLVVHPDPPPFHPSMVRATESLQHDPDWQTRMGGQYLQKGLLDAAHRGLTSSTAGGSFIPSLMKGEDISNVMKPKRP